MGLLPCILRSVTSFLLLEDGPKTLIPDSNSDQNSDQNLYLNIDSTKEQIIEIMNNVKKQQEIQEKKEKQNEYELNEYIDCLLWVESVLGLTMALISVTTALPALTDNGVISSIASVLNRKSNKLKVLTDTDNADNNGNSNENNGNDTAKNDQIVKINNGMNKSENGENDIYDDRTATTSDKSNNKIAITLVHIDSLIVQILDTAITNHSGSFTAFKEQGGAEAALVRLLDELVLLSTDTGIQDPSSTTVTITTSSTSAIESSVMDVVEDAVEKKAVSEKVEELKIMINSISDGNVGTSSGESKESSESEKNVLQSEIPSPTVLNLSSSEAMAAVVDGSRYKIKYLPPGKKVLLHQLISLIISWVQDSQQDSGDHLHGQLLKGPLFAKIFGVLFNNVIILSNSLISPTIALLADIINNDSAPPGLLVHLLSSGLIELALKTCINPGLVYCADLLLSISSLISATCLTQDGIDLIKQVNNNLFFYVL